MTFPFASIDPDRSGPQPPRARQTEADLTLAAAPPSGAEGWPVPLAHCWREIAAETAAGLRRADGHDVLAYAGTVLRVVEHALIELIGDPIVRPCCEPRGCLWCAAQALDADALVWHRWRPDAGRRFEALGAALQQRLGARSSSPPSRTVVAASVRRATEALEALAVGDRPACRALETLDGAAIALATVGVQIWEARRAVSRSHASRQLRATARGLAIQRQTAELLVAASGRARAPQAGRDGVGDWLAIALSRRLPLGLVAVIEDPGADRVLRAESLSVLRAAWISRGALELLAIRRLDGECQGSLRRPARPAAHRTAAARAAMHPASNRDVTGAWRSHSLALARAVATYLRACAADARLAGRTREELVELLADTLAHAARLDTLLGYGGEGGTGALDA